MTAGRRAASAGQSCRCGPTVRPVPKSAMAKPKSDGVYFSNMHDPSLTVVKADPRHANGAAVIVVPGGGHRMLVFHERRHGGGQEPEPRSA
jgi:hypothetical protein